MASRHPCKLDTLDTHAFFYPTHCTLAAIRLMNNEGSLLAFAADQARTTKTYAAIAASIWGTYKQESVGADTGAKGGLQFLIMDCEVKSS